MSTSKTPEPTTTGSTSEVASYLGVGHTHVYRLIDQGEIRAVKSDGKWRISWQSVNDYARRRKLPGRPKVEG